jgi:hypothetical protein
MTGLDSLPPSDLLGHFEDNYGSYTRNLLKELRAIWRPDLARESRAYWEKFSSAYRPANMPM